MAKAKYTRFVTPLGIAKYAWLDKPDTGFDGKSEPQYKLRLIIEDNEENRAWCDKIVEQAKIDAKTNGVKIKKNFKTPFQFPEDQDEDDFVPQDGKDKPKYDEDHKGAIFFEMKTRFKPGLIDAKRQELGEDVRIMSGDKVKAKLELFAYEGLGSGISFRVVTVQLIEKNSAFAGGGAPDTSGFEDEDGYDGGDNGGEEDEDF